MILAKISEDRNQIMMQGCFAGADGDQSLRKVFCRFEAGFRLKDGFAGRGDRGIKFFTFRVKRTPF